MNGFRTWGARRSDTGAGGQEVRLFADELWHARRLEAGGRARVEEVKRQRLRAVLEAAAETGVYGPHLSPAAIREGRLDALPPVTKSTFLERLDETVTDPNLTRSKLLSFVRVPERAGELLDGRYVVAMTSGTTGQVGIFVNDLESWARTRGLTFARLFRDHLDARGLLRLARYRRYRMAFIVATGGHFMTSLLAGRVPPLGRLVVDSRTFSIEMPLPSMVEELNRQRPHLLHSYPTVLELLCGEARAGRLEMTPDIITTGSEPMTATCRAAVADAFPEATLVETYAATECVPMASSCAEGNLHVNEDACVLEAVDEQGRPVAPGEVADHVLVTNLMNRVQPVVRYVLTDQVQPETVPCPCGSPLSHLRVHGRTDDTFFLVSEDGTWQAHPPIPFEVLFLSVPGLLQYQLVHEDQNVLRILFVVEEGAQGAQVAGVLDEKLSRYLAEHALAGSVRFTLEQVDRIDRHQKSRKVRQIMSRVPRPGGPAMSAPAVRERRRGVREVL